MLLLLPPLPPPLLYSSWVVMASGAPARDPPALRAAEQYAQRALAASIGATVLQATVGRGAIGASTFTVMPTTRHSALFPPLPMTPAVTSAATAANAAAVMVRADSSMIMPAAPMSEPVPLLEEAAEADVEADGVADDELGDVADVAEDDSGEVEAEANEIHSELDEVEEVDHAQSNDGRPASSHGAVEEAAAMSSVDDVSDDASWSDSGLDQMDPAAMTEEQQIRYLQIQHEREEEIRMTAIAAHEREEEAASRAAALASASAGAAAVAAAAQARRNPAAAAAANINSQDFFDSPPARPNFALALLHANVLSTSSASAQFAASASISFGDSVATPAPSTPVRRIPQLNWSHESMDIDHHANSFGHAAVPATIESPARAMPRLSLLLAQAPNVAAALPSPATPVHVSSSSSHGSTSISRYAEPVIDFAELGLSAEEGAALLREQLMLEQQMQMHVAVRSPPQAAR